MAFLKAVLFQRARTINNVLFRRKPCASYIRLLPSKLTEDCSITVQSLTYDFFFKVQAMRILIPQSHGTDQIFHPRFKLLLHEIKYLAMMGDVAATYVLYNLFKRLIQVILDL